VKQTADENMAKHTWLVKAAGAMMCLDDDDNNIVDVIVDVATTTVSVTSITATGGS